MRALTSIMLSDAGLARPGDALIAFIDCATAPPGFRRASFAPGPTGGSALRTDRRSARSALSDIASALRLGAGGNPDPFTDEALIAACVGTRVALRPAGGGAIGFAVVYYPFQSFAHEYRTAIAGVLLRAVATALVPPDVP